MATPFASGSASDRTTTDDIIAFFDVETTAPPKRPALLEFGAILVCPRRLVEVACYATLVRPAGAIPIMADRYNGITREAIARAPPFRDIADAVYDILHGRVWAGHNIASFDATIIREAFAEIGRGPPEPKGVIDTLPLLYQRFGRRAGDMKMASLANYFGLGRQIHRSLDDVRMNLQVLKCCSTVLLLEASPPKACPVPNTLLEASFPEVPNREAENSSRHSPNRWRTGDPAAPHDPVPFIEEMNIDATTQVDSSPNDRSGFLEPDNVSTECIEITVALLHRFGHFGPRTVIVHEGAELLLSCAGLKVHYGVRPKFLSAAGLPKLNIVVGIPDSLCKVLEFCDDLAKKSSPEAVGTSEWRPLVKKDGHMNRPSVRLNIPTFVRGDIATYSTDICKKESNGVTQNLVFRKVDAAELNSLLEWSTVDAFLSLEVYDYQQSAGIRLVAKRLVIHSR